MGLRGPAPIPTAVQRSRGNPSKRRLNDREPEFSPGAPKPPAHLTKRERFLWRQIVAIMSEIPGLLTAADQSVIADLATHLRILEEAKAALEKNRALIVKDPETGKTIKNPYLAMVQEETGIINTLRREIGFTPSARSRLSVEPKGKGKEATGILNGQWQPDPARVN